MSRKYTTAAKLKEMYYFTRLKLIESFILILHGDISFYRTGIVSVYSALCLLHCQIAPYILMHLDPGAVM